MSQQFPVRLSALLQNISVRFEEAELYYGHGTDNAWDEAVYLVFTTLGISFETDESVLLETLGPEQIARIEDLVSRRIDERTPVAYLVGEAWFAGRPYNVDERVLIPRSPLAELIINDLEPLLRNEPGRILDLCTGSGCIGIACALQFPGARVELSDISSDALELAQENIRRHAVQERVKVVESDLFQSLVSTYDLIITNPPYVAADEIAALPPEYRREPRSALYSPDDGLALPLQILREAADYLAEDGLLIMEVGFSQDALNARLPRVPLLWLEFERGGSGVFALTAEQLRQYREHFH